MRILLNTYEPSLTDGNDNTSTGGGQWLQYLIDKLTEAGHEVVNASVGESDLRIHALGKALGQQIDVILLCWRWPMEDYPQRHAAYERQQFLLNLASKTNTPVLIHDQDLKSNILQELTLYPRLRCLLTMPAFNPPPGYSTLHFPNPFNLNVPLPSKAALTERLYSHTYIGNNYERYDIMKQTWGHEAEFTSNIWGNWLEPSSNRESPEQVVKDFPSTVFHGRLPQSEALTVLGQSMFTQHFAKPEYDEYGFMTIRWCEAAAAGCLAFCDPLFIMPEAYRNAFVESRMAVEDEGDYLTYLHLQRRIIESVQSIEPWFVILQGLADNRFAQGVL